MRIDPSLLGLILVLSGLAAWSLALLALRRVSARQASERQRPSPLLASEDGTACITLEPGGRLISMNLAARSLFDIQADDSLGLESLARRVRPADKFYQLCAQDGLLSFAVSGQAVEAESHQVPGLNVRLVSLRRSDRSSLMTQGGGQPETLNTYIELSQAIASSLDLNETLLAVLQNIQKLVPADLWEINVWDEENRVLTPYRLIGNPDGSNQISSAAERYTLEQGYTGYLASRREPLLIADVSARQDLQPEIDITTYPLRSYLGVPLLVGHELIGTLELASLTANAFQESDLAVVRLISGQAAIAIHNARLYQQEQRRTAELSGLAEVAQAFVAVRDPRNLFSRLVQSIASLLPVEIVGFLIYNEAARTLEGQAPFYGLPQQIVDEYSVPVQPGSPAEKRLLEQDLIVSENAANDADWAALGLQFLAQAASMRETVLVPLASGGRVLGYLQASNHTNGATSFSKDELHLLMIVANQAAPVIENASLVNQARQRAQRAEALRRIGSLASSAATLTEILQFSLVELVRLLGAHRAGIFLLDEERTTLRLHRESLFGTPPDLPDRQTQLKAEDPQFPFTVTGGQHSLRSGNLLDEKALIPFYQSIVLAWGLQSVVVVPLVVRDEGIGELWIGSQYLDSFDQGDVQVIATAAGQLAGVVEQANLTAQTDESLRRRVDQLTALTRITRELSTSLDLNYLLQLVYDESLRTTRADCGTIQVFDLNQPEGRSPVTRFYLGDPPAASLSRRDAQVIANGEVLHIPVVAADAADLPHGEVQSLLLVPIVFQQRPAGLISLHARTPNRFDSYAIEIAQSLAAQAAVAFGNALQYEDQLRHSELLKRELETLSEMFQVSQALRSNQPLDQSLEAISSAIQQATPFQTILISVLDEESGMLRRVHGKGLPPDAWEALRSHPQPWSGIESILQPEFQFENAYFIPADKLPVVPEDVHTITILPSAPNRSSDAWDPDDMLLIPLFQSSGRPTGLVSVDAPADGRRPDRATLEALELFANQAAILIENQKSMSLLKAQLDRVEDEAERLEQAQAELPELRDAKEAQSVQVQRLQGLAEDMRASLEITEQASRQTGLEDVLRTMAGELIARFGFHVVLSGANRGGGPQFLEAAGKLPEGVNLEALFGQRNPLRQTLSDGNLLLVADVTVDPAEWQTSSLVHALNARSFVSLPLTVSEEQRVALCAFSVQPLPAADADTLYLFERLARQVSIRLQNMGLLEETRRRLEEVNLLLDFTRKLGSLDANNILNALLESALTVLPEAEAGWVALWEPKSQQLTVQAASGYAHPDSLLGVTFSAELSPEALPLSAFQSGQTHRLAEVNFGRTYQLPADDLLSYRKASAGRLPVSALMVPISLGEHALGVLMVEDFDASNAFSRDDETLALSLAQQTALALENARLFRSTEERTAQLQALTQVAGTITSSLQTRELVASLLDQLKPVVPFETATLWLRRGSQLMIGAATGFDDNESRVGLAVDQKDSALFQGMIGSGKAISVVDVRGDERFPTGLVEPEFLSWLGIPLVAKSQLIGLIALEKREAGYYTPDHIQVAATFAGQAAIALENARLFEESSQRAAELDQRSKRLAMLNQFSREVGASLDVEHILGLTARQMLSALGGDRVAVALVESQGRYSLHSEFPAGERRLPWPLPAVPLLDRIGESLGIFTTEDANSEPELLPLVEGYLGEFNVRGLLVVPLVSAGVLQGWLLLQNQKEYRYSVPEIELARTLSNQAATAVQNARLLAETRRLTEDLERRVEERTAELSREHRNTQTMLQIITELSASLDLDQVLNRTLAILNQSIGAAQSLILLANSGRVYKVGQPLAMMGRTGLLGGPQPERELAQWVMRQRSAALVDDLGHDARWDFPPEFELSYASVMALPLMVGEDVLGTLLLLHPEAGFFQLEQVALTEAAARQISIALNNAELFGLIRDQAEHLGGMLRDQQIEASRSRAILEAVADGVVVTDAANRITLFNTSAERILEMEADQVINRTLDELGGLFGPQSSTWMDTVHRWAVSTDHLQSGESFAGQYTLENDRVVSIHLAPVLWRSDFLGTVSIFRDITHEVQVDRLKSEFVANVSHELRTPLTSIKGYVEIMLMGAAGTLNDQQEHFLQIVQQNTSRLSILVNDLLDISRIEAGRVNLSLQPVDLAELTQDVMGEIHKRMKDEGKRLMLETRLASKMPPVLGDPARVRQVLASLIGNSYNYTPEGGRIRLDMHQQDGVVQVDVCDSGIGIAPRDQLRIFERFYRGEDPLVLATAGTGLGLAIAKILVEMHHGQIWFHSSGVRGEGATFSFTLPVVKEEEVEWQKS